MRKLVLNLHLYAALITGVFIMILGEPHRDAG